MHLVRDTGGFYLGAAVRTGRGGHQCFRAKLLVKLQRHFARGEALRGRLSLGGAVEMHQPALARKVQAGPFYAHVLAGFAYQHRRWFLSRTHDRLRKSQAHLVPQVKRSFLRLVLQTDGIPTSIGKSKGYALVGLRYAGATVESYAVGLHARGTGFRQRRILRHEFGVGGTHKVESHVATTYDAAILLIVLATMGVNDVVAIAGFAEDRDLHFFEQTGILALEFSGFRRRDFEDRAVLLVEFLEGDTRGLTGDIYRSGRRSLGALDVPNPVAFQIYDRGDPR